MEEDGSAQEILDGRKGEINLLVVLFHLLTDIYTYTQRHIHTHTHSHTPT